MQTSHTICFGISGTLIAGLIAYICSLQNGTPLLNVILVILFILAPAVSCIAGGLTDYRIAAMILIYTLAGAFLCGATAPAVAIAPRHRELYDATRHLSGDIGAWREIIGGVTLAIGRILFIRNRPKTKDASPSELN